MNKKLNINKTISTVVILNIFQIVIAIAALIYNYIKKDMLQISGKLFEGDILLYLIILSILVNSFFTVRNVLWTDRYNNDYDTFKATVQQLENFNNTLRRQRHDFMNHLQVVYGLMELDEYKESKDYLERVFNDIQKVNRVLKTSNPAVNALLQAKVLFAEKRGISIELFITSQLKELKIPAWEFCRVLGNIIDNAIFALKGQSGDKVITIELFEDIKNYGFKIKNNGPKIESKLIDKIFEPGFTTKGEAGEGMGLAIVSDTLKQYGGIIEVQSDDEATVFQGLVPRQDISLLE